jgi:hypothetical protein
MYHDPDGEFVITTTALLVAAGAALLATVGGFVGNYIADKKGVSGWGKIGYIAGAAVVGGIAGGVVGAVVAPVVVNWSTYTKHGLERMAERGITQPMVNIWVSTGKVLQQGADKFAFITKQGMAVVTSAGKLVTTYSCAQYDAAMKEIIKKYLEVD